MSKGGSLSDEEDSKKSKKAKRTGPSLLQLEREKYSRGTAAAMKGIDAKGKKVRREDEGIMDALASFKSKLLDAKSAVVEDEIKSKPEGIWGDNKDDLDEEDNDEGWLSHELIFRKDATLDRRKSYLNTPRFYHLFEYTSFLSLTFFLLLPHRYY